MELLMNRSVHMGVGAVVGGTAYLVLIKIKGEQPTFPKLLGYSLAGAFVATIPDLLEPAIQPNHRAFFHSVLFNGILVIATNYLWRNPDISLTQRIFWTTLSLAFLSHPLLDSTTPKGIPLIKKGG